jgi:type II secretory pathway pseudopilin PulG
MKKSGFSIIELLVVMTITSMLGGIVVSVIISTYTNNRKLEASSLVQRDVNLALDKVNKVLRSATEILETTPSNIKIRGYPNVSDIAPSEINFFLDASGSYNVVRYSVIPPTGMAPTYTYDPNNAVTYTLVPRVTNTSISNPPFTYYDENNAAISVPINMADVRSVQFNVSALDVQGVSNVQTFTNVTSLRNFKTNL